MEIEYQISRKEFINFHLEYYKHTPYYKAWVFCLDIIAIPCFFVFVLSSKFNRTYTIIGLGALVIIFFMSNKIISYYYEKGIKRLYSLKIYDNYFLHTKMLINEKGICITTNLCSIFFNWSSLNHLYVVNNNIYIDTFMREFIFIGNEDIEENTRRELIEMIEKYTDIKPTLKVPIIIYA